jgi:3,4-dihydroxy 2-butanone 4-phosphate synthase/GTP cyclohydrolase II
MRPTLPIDDALEDIRRGRMVILSDELHDEAMLCMAADAVTPDDVNFMVTHARGLVCLCITQDRIRALGIPMLAPDRPSTQHPFGASIEAARGVTTGISAGDRATTIAAAIADDAGPDDVVMPGHIFPMLASDGGVLMRRGMTEAAVDLARLAGHKPGAVVCAILDDAGELAGKEDLEALAELYELRTVEIDDIIAHRLRNESVVTRIADAPITTAFGARFRTVVYRSEVDKKEHLALVKGRIKAGDVALVRIHSQCLTGDVFGSERCDCGDQLKEAVERIDAAGKGVLVYMHQEGRGIGLANKIRAYALQDQGFDTVQANLELGFADDSRDYGMAAQILRDLGITKVCLLTNNPKKIDGLKRYGIDVVERSPIEIPAHKGNLRYLQTKKLKLGHLFTGLEPNG